MRGQLQNPKPTAMRMDLLLRMTLLLSVASAFNVEATACPGTMSAMDSFIVNGTAWTACEDLVPGGSIALVSAASTEMFGKGYEIYGNASDDDFYLDVGKKAAVANKSDVLALALLADEAGVSWRSVASAVPPIRRTGTSRTWVGSRGSTADTTFTDAGEDAAQYGFPPALSYVFNLTNEAEGGSFLQFGKTPATKRDVAYVNSSGMAEGLVGGHLPIVVFYYPLLPPCNASTSAPTADSPAAAGAGAGTGAGGAGGPAPVASCSPFYSGSAEKSRFWTMVASGTPDMQGSREQQVWFRYQQVECEGRDFQVPISQGSLLQLLIP